MGRVIHNIDLDSIEADATPDSPKFRAEGQLVVESDAGEFTAKRTPQWRVVSLKLLSGDEPPPADSRRGGGGPGRREPRQIKGVQVDVK